VQELLVDFPFRRRESDQASNQRTCVLPEHSVCGGGPYLLF
jgi:hypothetical protein